MRIGIPEILLLILLAVILLGARRIPELGAALGKALREFRKAEKGEKTSFDSEKAENSAIKNAENLSESSAKNSDENN